MSSSNRNVPGMDDVLPRDSSTWQRIEQATHDVFSLYGFREMRTPLLEETTLFARGIGEATQVVQKEMYTFIDRGGDSVTLRPEGTAGIVRAVVQHHLLREEPVLKVYYGGPMFRYERPQKGRLRQFHQIGAEIFGTAGPTADAELIIMLERLVKKLGIQDYQLDINNLGIESERSSFIETLKSFLKEISEKLCATCRERAEKNPLRVLDCKSETCQALLDSAPQLSQNLGESSRTHFDQVRRQLTQAGVAFRENPRLVRGLDYYDLTAFEFSSPHLGSQSAFAGGGRYNRLVAELGGPPTPAVGFAIGCERLLLMLQAAKTTSETPELKPGIFFVALDASSYDAATHIVQNLRDSGVASAISFELKSLKAQMKQADRSGLKYAAVLGENEMKSQTVMLKNLLSGEQKQVPLDQLKNCLES